MRALSDWRMWADDRDVSEEARWVMAGHGSEPEHWERLFDGIQHLLLAWRNVPELVVEKSRGEVSVLGVHFTAPADWRSLELTADRRTAVAQATLHGKPGCPECPGGLNPTLVIEVVRRYLATLPSAHPGWLAASRDPIVGRALALLHGRPAEAWTLDSLAREAGLSRSALADHFIAMLRPQGRLFIVVGREPAMEAQLITLQPNGATTTSSLFETVLAPLINAERPEPFVL